MLILLGLILAHFIADFWMQTDEMAKNKSKFLKNHLIHHSLVTGVVLLLLWGTIYDFNQITYHLILPFAVIVISHGLIDWTKIKMTERIMKRQDQNLKQLGWFLLDQTLHLLIIISVGSLFLNLNYNTVISSFNLSSPNQLNLPEILVLIGITIILATTFSSTVIKFVIGTLPTVLTNYEGELTLKNQRESSDMNIITKKEHSINESYQHLTYSAPIQSRGKYIGYAERIIVIILTIAGAYEAIAFIIAAKSIARFKQLDDRNWAEYFLLGTLTSIVLGMIIGLIAKGVL